MKPILKKAQGDRYLWFAVIMLAVWSLLAVYSATQSLEWRSKDAREGHFLMKQFTELALGFVIIFVVHRIHYIKVKRWAKILFFVSILLLAYTLVFGASINEGARWIKIPGTGKTIQSSDVAKLSIFIYLAYLLSKKQTVIHKWRQGFLPVLSPVIIICILIAPANLSTALLLMAACSILFFIGRVSLKHIGVLILVGILGLGVIFTVSKISGKGRAETWENRIKNFGGSGDEDANFQTTQAKIAIANGKLFGKGPGNSEVKDILPHPYSDFIYAIILEEYGLIGGVGVISLYLLFLWRSIVVFRKCPYAFGAFLSIGLSFTLVFQALINMGVNVNLLPVTGLTLPMMSMGGSSIWFTSIAIGLILSVSRYVYDLEGKEAQKIATQVARIDNQKLLEPS